MEPFDEPYWNLRQLFAWIVWGDRKLVTEFSDRNDSGQNTDHVTIFSVFMSREHQGRKIVKDVGKVTRFIIYELQKGQLHAEGFANGVGDLKPIPSEQWAWLGLYFDPDCAAPLASRRKAIGATRWYGLKFPRQEILALAPDVMALLVDELLENGQTEGSGQASQTRATESIDPAPHSNKGRGAPIKYDRKKIEAALRKKKISLVPVAGEQAALIAEAQAVAQELGQGRPSDTQVRRWINAWRESDANRSETTK